MSINEYLGLDDDVQIFLPIIPVMDDDPVLLYAEHWDELQLVGIDRVLKEVE